MVGWAKQRRYGLMVKNTEQEKILLLIDFGGLKVRLFLSMMMDKKDLSGESRVFFFTLSSTDDPSPLLRHATSRHPPLQIEVHLMLARILELMQVTLSSVTYYLAKDRGAAAGIACDKL